MLLETRYVGTYTVTPKPHPSPTLLPIKGKKRTLKFPKKMMNP